MKRLLLVGTLVFGSLAVAPAAARAQGAALASFRELPSDPEPEAITKDTHYWVSNEQHLDFFHEQVQDRGGVYVGVGTDQNYLLAAWARAELLVLMDFDQSVVDLHRVYELAFRKAASKDEFLRLWSEPAREEMREMIREAFPDRAEQKIHLKAYGSAQRFVARRLGRVMHQMKKAGLSSFLTNDDDYSHIRKLFVDGKVFMVRGDLTADGTLKAIGAATRDAGKVVRVLYLSNAEQYFLMPKSYRANIQSLPVDDRSIALRTIGRPTLALVDDKYHYNVQRLDGFQAFTRDKRTMSSSYMAAQATPTATYGLSLLDAGPPESSKERRARRRAREKAEKPLREAYELAQQKREERKARREERKARREEHKAQAL